MYVGNLSPPHTMTETLDSWLGRRPVAMDARALSPVRIARRSDRIVFGVLGTRNKMSYEDFVEHILDPVIEAWGMPEEFVIPGDGESGEVIQTWASRNDIPVCRITADWVRNGKRAGLLRDSCIQREASHLILLQGPRSNALTKLAGKLQRKGKPVALSERPGEPVRAFE